MTHNPVVMAFGRMNPPTIGHEKLVNKVKEIANDYSAPHHVIISHSIDAKKNPLDAKTKLTHAKRMFPGTNLSTSSKEEPTFLQHAAKLHKAGHDHLVMVAGSDRVDEYIKKLHEYNGTKEENPKALYNFKKIEVKSAGERDPDAEGAEGMSASKMREHAKNNDFHSFKQGVPAHMPEKHTKELFNDVRSGMGLHENVNRGLFKAIFLSGGPGSGKDIIIHEAIADRNIVEMNSTVAINLLNDKHKLSESSKNLNKEAIRNRKPLLINGPINEKYNMIAIKEELEELGYETMMIFVNTSNESSKIRNESLTRMMSESVRKEKWELTQLVAEQYNQEFGKYLEFDNSLDLNTANVFEQAEKEENIGIIYEMINWFLDMDVQNEIAESWIERKSKSKQDRLFEQLLEKEKTHVPIFKENRKAFNAKAAYCSCGTKTGRKLFTDNICPSCQLVRKQGREDQVTDGDVKSNRNYIFRTYSESAGPKIYTAPEKKETNFEKDNDKIKSKKKYGKAEAGKVIKTAGVSPEYDTRGSGTVYPMSGLGNVTYREQNDTKYGSNTAEVTRKSFSRFRKESIDSPSTEMGVTGGEYGPSNKEPMETLNKIPVSKKKKK